MWVGSNNKDYSTLESILGPMTYGTYHIYIYIHIHICI